MLVVVAADYGHHSAGSTVAADYDHVLVVVTADCIVMCWQ